MSHLAGGDDTNDAMDIDLQLKAPDPKRARQTPDVLVYTAQLETEAPSLLHEHASKDTAPLVLVYKTGKPPVTQPPV
eukprot:483893-Rhodomonas_salina.4